MAVDFKDAPGTSRINIYLMDPREITVKPELNGRHELPEIDDIVAGFMEIGQTTPVLIGKDGGRPVLYAGHRRWRAALEITKKKLLPKTEKNPDQVFKLKCTYFEGDEKTAFLATISENHDRKSATEIDDAHNIVKLRRWEYSDEEIAGVYRKKVDGKPDISWVAKTASLVSLCDEAVQAMKDGRIKPSAAVEIAKLAKAAQKERLATPGKITASAVKASMKSSGKTDAADDKPVKRKLSDLREFWLPYSERKEGKLGKIAVATLAYLDGGDEDAYFRSMAEVLR